jgi:hypothetical protein
VRARMIVFVITQQLPPILVVALLILVYLTWLEIWHEEDLTLWWKAFWILFVFLGHVFGYGIFRAWLALHRHGRKTA